MAKDVSEDSSSQQQSDRVATSSSPLTKAAFVNGVRAAHAAAAVPLLYPIQLAYGDQVKNNSPLKESMTGVMKEMKTPKYWQDMMRSGHRSILPAYLTTSLAPVIREANGYKPLENAMSITTGTAMLNTLEAMPKKPAPLFAANFMRSLPASLSVVSIQKKIKEARNDGHPINEKTAAALTFGVTAIAAGTTTPFNSMVNVMNKGESFDKAAREVFNIASQEKLSLNTVASNFSQGYRGLLPRMVGYGGAAVTCIVGGMEGMDRLLELKEQQRTSNGDFPLDKEKGIITGNDSVSESERAVEEFFRNREKSSPPIKEAEWSKRLKPSSKRYKTNHAESFASRAENTAQCEASR